MAKLFVGLDSCPYCKSSKVMVDETRYENEPNNNPNKPEDGACLDFICQSPDCGKGWTVVCQAVCYHTYDAGVNNDEFNPEEKPFIRG